MSTPITVKERLKFSVRFAVLTTAMICAILGTQAQFVGADLNYSTANDELKVSLICYYDCAYNQIPLAQSVSIVETMAKGSQQYVALEQASIEETSSTNAAPCKDLNACLKKATFTAIIPINPVPGGYDITWVHKLNQSFQNIGTVEGISLTTHVGELALIDGNSSPHLPEAPTGRGCIGYENSSLMQTVDLVHSDSIRVELSPVKSAYSEFDPGAEHKVGPEGMEAIPFPPFKEMTYLKNHAFNQPFGNDKIAIDAKSNLLKFEPNQAGKYLVAFTIYDLRNGKEIGTSQRIFITDLK